jgi:hypothetical protein
MWRNFLNNYESKLTRDRTSCKLDAVMHKRNVCVFVYAGTFCGLTSAILDCIHALSSIEIVEIVSSRTTLLASCRYVFIAERIIARNGISSALWEALLCETLCFYCGPSSAVDAVDPRAFICIDVDAAPAATIACAIRDAMASGQWERRLTHIRAAKARILEEQSLCPVLERALFCSRRAAPVVCFVHSCHFEDVGLAILAEVLQSLERVCFDEVFIYNVGARIGEAAWARLAATAPRTCKCATLIETGSPTCVYELPTLHAMHVYAQTTPLARMLYVHTKGVSRGIENVCVADWRVYMLYMLTVHARACIAKLETVDVVGCNYLSIPYPHFSGNFWWTLGAHVRAQKLDALTDKASAEWWIFSTRPRAFHCVWQSGIQSHYSQRYLPMMYE